MSHRSSCFHWSNSLEQLVRHCLEDIFFSHTMLPPFLSFFNDPAFQQKAVHLLGKLIRTRNPDLLEADGKKVIKLKRCLTTLDLTSLGVGSCVGTGMYLVAGMVAHYYAGPGVIFSFIIAAVAALFSGVCYAEFGVRVPHTTGSAYMYSYVTVGEFLAFVIGWNMVLEYLIGSAACACALSACFDALANGAVTDALNSVFGSFFGRPPDFMAFGVCILMTFLLVAGVRKSLVFNNIMNSFNLAIWVFIMTAGLFYIDTDNWSKSNGGFLPYGWPGVLTGAATCFYAFIGFDIIATTGEEAVEPKKSIPQAIIISLAIILTAYVTSSMMATLILPYNQLDPDSALVEMWAQRGSYPAKAIVSLGAIAGLSVSMFGSMFPMPRVVYAMAKDGLIFKFLATVWPLTGTPAIATLIFGTAAAFAALIIRLDVLVEMMSIGTLLAYTLVSTCVLILRYQPEKTSLIEFLPESIRGPDHHKRTEKKVVRIKKGSNSKMSPDSDEPAAEERYSGGNVPSNRDDEYLVSGGKATYGSVGKGEAGGSSEQEGKFSEPTALTEFYRKTMTFLEAKFPKVFPWRDRSMATEESGLLVTKVVGLLYIFVIIFDLIVVCDINYMDAGSSTAMFFIIVFLILILACLTFISRKPQNRKTLKFMAPGLPFVPGIAITVNIYLILKLSVLTLVRFTLWMIIGMFVYFKYGIKNSTLDRPVDDNMEMTVAQTGEDDSGVNSVANNYHAFPESRGEKTSDYYSQGDYNAAWGQSESQPPSKGQQQASGTAGYYPTSWDDEPSTNYPSW